MKLQLVLMLYWLLLPFEVLFGFEKVVIWGHKLHTHTHSYVHNAFFRAFEHLGYPTYWFDDQDEVSDFDFANSLFITEGQVDRKIPVRDDCDYILHNCNREKYQALLDSGHCILLQVFTKHLKKENNLTQVEPCIYYDIENKVVYMPWATDLLPDEIDAIKTQVPFFQKKRTIYWVGTIANGPGGNIKQMEPFKQACIAKKIEFIHMNPWIKGISVQENISLIQQSYMAPTIVGTWQNENGYIPCRIFKNISYGQMGITNSKTVYELLEKKIVYNPNTYQLFFAAERRLKKMSLDELYDLMELVKTKHTYLNRIQTLLTFFDLVKQAS